MHESMSTYDALHLHSEEVADIIGKMPGRSTRFGMFTFSIFFLILLGLLWYIRYPDILHAQITIYAKNSPKTIVSHTSGKLIKIFVHEGQSVRQGDILAIMESNAVLSEIYSLDSFLRKTSDAISTDKWQEIKINISHFTQLGEIQPIFQLFYSSYYQVTSLLSDKIYSRKKEFLQTHIDNTVTIRKNLSTQKDLLSRDLMLADEEYNAQKKLKEYKVISASEFRKEESKLLEKRSSLETINNSIINNENTLASYQRELLDIEKQLSDAKYNLQDNLNKLQNEIIGWKKKYLVITPLDGTINFFQGIQELQDASAEQTLFFVSPITQGNFSEMYVVQNNFGKIQVGQKVVIHLNSFPFQQYGSLIGKVTFIASVPTQAKEYLVRVELPTDLTTDYGFRIPFSNGLVGNAQIIMQRQRLITKLFYSFKELFSKQTNSKSSSENKNTI